MKQNRCLTCAHSHELKLTLQQQAQLSKLEELPKKNYVCRAHPPVVHFIPVPNEITKEMTMQAITVFPQIPPDGYGCSEHKEVKKQ